MIALKQIIPLIRYSPSEIASLEEAKESKCNFVLDLSKIEKYQRLEFQVCIGPKGIFDNDTRPHGTYIKVVFEETFYDVAYFVREMDPLSLELQEMDLTVFPERSNKIYSENLNRPPEKWVGSLAIGRQVRCFMNEFNNLNQILLPSISHENNNLSKIPKLFTSGYHLRLSICNDGIVGAVGPNHLAYSGIASFEPFAEFNLPYISVVEMLTSPTENESDFFDVSSYDPKFQKGTLFLRRTCEQQNLGKYEMVIVANVLNESRYYQLPHEFANKVEHIRDIWIKQIKRVVQIGSPKAKNLS